LLSLEIKEEPDEQWNNRLFKSNLATIYQTKEWGDLLMTERRKPNFIKFIDEKGNIVGQLLVFFETNTKKPFLKNLAKKILNKKKSIYTWSYGPIIFEKIYFQEIMIKLVNFLKSKNSKIKGVGHPLLESDIDFLKPKIEITNWITFMIDLNCTEDQIYQKIEKHSGKKNIERSIRRGVNIEEISYNSLMDYVNLINKTRNDKEKLSLEQMQKTWNTLRPLGYSGILAKKDGIPVGGLMFSFLNRYIIEAGVARSEEGFKENLYSQDLIKWKIIQWGVKNEMKFYNLAGANPKPATKKEEGILRYKTKWGGKKYHYWIING
jgi:lipid II:glycine glycyltransferase (peptidoglycan interpeptide bridge formation enzyme)